MKIYYGWWIVAIALVLQMLTVGATMNTFGMYVVEASKDLGLSRANANTGIILISAGMALFSPIVGRMLDVYPVRRIMVAGALLFCASFAILGLSHNVWLSAFALAVPLPLGIACVGHLAATTVLARWFVAQRGRAMALAMVGMSLGTVVMAPTIGLLIKSLGWRTCLMVLGAVFAVIFLVLVPLMRDRPAPDEIEPVPARAAGQPPVATPPLSDAKPLKIGAILAMPIFWVLSLSVALALSVLQTVAISIVPLAQESGISVEASSTLLMVLGAMSLLGKLVLAWIGDRIDRVLTLVAIFLFQCFACALLLVGHSFPVLLFCAALQGLCAAAITPVFGALLADRVGAASFGTAQGAAALAMALCSAVMVRVGGEIYDRTGSYQVMFTAFAVVSLFAALLVLSSKWLPGPRQATAAA
ncbi:MAG: MFS transporter [Novosphingobium sp.]